MKKYLKHFFYFYELVGYRMLLALSGSIFVGFLDGLGLAMFLPLLESVDGQIDPSAESLEGLKAILSLFELLGIPLDLTGVLLTMLFFFLLKGVFRFVDGYYKVLLTQYFVKKLRIDNVDLLVDYSYQSFVKSDVGRIQNTLTAEMGRVTSAFGYYLSSMQSFTLLSVYISMAFMANPQFALLISIGGALSNFAFKAVYRITVNISREITGVGHRYQGLLIQLVNNFKYLQASGSIRQYSEKLKVTIVELTQFAKKAGFYNVTLLSVREPMVILVVVMVILVEVNWLGQPLGIIILSLLFFYRALNFVISLQTQWNSFLNNQGALENLESFQNDLILNKTRTGGKKFEKIEQSIQIENGSFGYDDGLVLKDINLNVPKNWSIAFVGESGSGKTTLVNIVSGLLEFKTGSVSIDGVNVNEYDLRSYQEKIGYITQEPVIFNDSVFNNVTFWSPKTPENLDRFWQSLKMASINEFVISQELKEETLLGNNGVNLSGGQRQRISIARELFKDVQILVMDEATSALDSETEYSIQKNIELLKGEFTIFIVAHRLSTIRYADLIILMSNGEISGCGTYAELLEKSDIFKNMVELQELND